MSTAITTELLPAITDEVSRKERLFELAQRKAKVYANSTLVPKDYQGNIGNVLIAENMARRMEADVLMVMQNLYVVHGRPGWSSQFLIATFNSCGRFSALRYEFVGKPGADNWGCCAYATELNTGEKLKGTTVTMSMANAEGWVKKNGSKWQTMPEQMLRYRAASFFIRTTAPEIGMGLMTKEELEDIGSDNVVGPSKPVRSTASLDDISERFASTTSSTSEPEPETETETTELAYRPDFLDAARVGFDECDSNDAVSKWFETQSAQAQGDEEHSQLTAMAAAARKRIKGAK
jgi:hypothetical protein